MLSKLFFILFISIIAMKASLASAHPQLSPEDALIIAQAKQTPAAQILAPKEPILSPIIPLTGSIEEYVGKVVFSNQMGKVTAVNFVPCQVNVNHRCVEVVGEACPSPAKNEDCEGLSLTVVIDVSSTKYVLDSGLAGRRRVYDQSDIEKALPDSP